MIIYMPNLISLQNFGRIVTNVITVSAVDPLLAYLLLAFVDGTLLVLLVTYILLGRYII